MMIILKLKLHDYKIPTIVTNTVGPGMSDGAKTLRTSKMHMLTYMWCTQYSIWQTYRQEVYQRMV